MIVYASFLPDEMGQQGGQKRSTMSQEAELLKQFLKLAYKGPASSGDVGIAVPRSRHIEDVAEEIRQLGFEVTTQLGLSSLRVDLALRRPDSEQWEIAVMVDDSCWSDRGSAFQREVLPRQVLPAMGSRRVYRIWLPSWKNSKDEILNELRELFTANLDEDIEAMDEVDESDDAASVDDLIDDFNGMDNNDSNGTYRAPSSSPTPYVHLESDIFEVFTPYTGGEHGTREDLDTYSVSSAAKKRVLAAIDAVLEAEAPIEITRLAKTVCNAFGLSVVKTPRIDQIISLIPRGQIKKDSIGSFVWRSKDEWSQWTRFRTSIGVATRTPMEIPAIEYGNALVDFVQRAHSLEHDDALKEIAQAFGIQRLTAQTKTNIEKAMKETVKTGKLVFSNGVYQELN
jgi:hypothetical protein